MFGISEDSSLNDEMKLLLARAGNLLALRFICLHRSLTTK